MKRWDEHRTAEDAPERTNLPRRWGSADVWADGYNAAIAADLYAAMAGAVEEVAS